MSQFINQYFDVNFMINHFDPVFTAFWKYTIPLWLISGALALIWGLILATLRQIPGRAGLPIRILAITYIDAFRGIPMLLVILLIAGGLGALSAGAAIPGPIPESIAVPTWLGYPSPFWYGVMACTITYGAYMAEVYRAGIEAVPQGQVEAARSLGMSHGQSMRYVVIPQAVRTVIPPLLNDLIALMKDTSLVSVIALLEVVQVGRDIQSKTFNSSALMLGAILFLVLTIPLARLVDWLIARQQAKTRRGGGGEGPDLAALQPLPTAGGGASAGTGAS